MCKRIILFALVIMMLLSQTALAKKDEYKITYIGEDDSYNYYMYDNGVYTILNFTSFAETGSWSAQIIREPKSEATRQFLISLLAESRSEDAAHTIVLSPKDNKLWAISAWLIYDAPRNKFFVKDTYWLNKDCDDIAINYTERLEASPGLWEVKDMVTAHLRAKYAEQGKVVR